MISPCLMTEVYGVFSDRAYHHVEEDVLSRTSTKVPQRRNRGAREIILFAKCLLCKSKDPSSIQNLFKNLGMWCVLVISVMGT